MGKGKKINRRKGEGTIKKEHKEWRERKRTKKQGN
jgi:hypothetical protein